MQSAPTGASSPAGRSSPSATHQRTRAASATYSAGSVRTRSTTQPPGGSDAVPTIAARHVHSNARPRVPDRHRLHGHRTGPAGLLGSGPRTTRQHVDAPRHGLPLVTASRSDQWRTFFSDVYRAETMTPDPKLTADQVAKISAEILKCQRLLRKLWHDDSRREVLARRRTLYRIMYAIPQGVPLPIDWAPTPHPQTTSNGAAL